jgi:hypothetical protein
MGPFLASRDAELLASRCRGSRHRTVRENENQMAASTKEVTVECKYL